MHKILSRTAFLPAVQMCFNAVRAQPQSYVTRKAREHFVHRRRMLETTGVMTAFPAGSNATMRPSVVSGSTGMTMSFSTNRSTATLTNSGVS